MKILILDRDADRYRDHLQRQIRDQAVYCQDPAAAEPGCCDVLLARPDWAANYLESCIGHSKPVPLWIQSTWAGVTPLVAMTRTTGTALTGIKGIFGPMIAEYVMSHILADSQQHIAFRASQLQHQWRPAQPTGLAGKKMVILGTGSVGSHLAAVASTGFGMSVQGISRQGLDAPGFSRVVPVSRANLVIHDADYLVLALPDTPATRGIVDAGFLAQLPGQSMVINVGRGSSLVDADLLAAIDLGKVRCAVLDVFNQEPLPANHPFWGHDAITITPHIAAISYPGDISRIFLENLSRFRAGERLNFLIDSASGY